MTTEGAIRRAMGAWGLSDSQRMCAVQALVNGANPQEVCILVEQIANAAGGIEYHRQAQLKTS